MNRGDKHWSEVTEKGTSVGMQFLWVVYRFLGRPVFSVITAIVIAYFYLVAKEQRKAARQFQQQVATIRLNRKMTPWKPKPFRQFLSFGRAALDKISAWIGDIDEKDILFPQFETMKEAVYSGRGGVILVSHHGNIEICRALGKHISGLKINAVVHTRNAEKFNELLNKVAPESNLNLIEVSSLGPETAVKMLDRIEQGEFICIVADRTSVNHRERCLPVRFMDKTAHLPEGPFILASILKCPVYYMACTRNGRGFVADFRLYANQLVLDRKDRKKSLGIAAQNYATWLEDLALNHPTEWFNFFDFWRPPKD